MIMAALAVCLQMLVNCSQPLEGNDDRRPAPPGPIVEVDTIILTDTIVHTDTVVDNDTIVQIDTVIQVDTVTDTVIQVDTVIVPVPDTSGALTLCSRLSSYQKEIVWMLPNPEGRFLMEFVATAERNQPPQTLIVDIDGNRYEWYPRDSKGFTIEADLNEHVSIVVSSEPPPSFGHSIDICLTASPL